MSSFLNRLLGRKTVSPAFAAAAAQRKGRSAYMRHYGHAVDGTEAVSTMVPLAAFLDASEQSRQYEVPLRFLHYYDFSSRTATNAQGEPAHDRLAMLFDNGEFAMTHERLQPNDDQNLRPTFDRVAELVGTLHGSKAYILLFSDQHRQGVGGEFAAQQFTETQRLCHRAATAPRPASAQFMNMPLEMQQMMAFYDMEQLAHQRIRTQVPAL